MGEGWGGGEISTSRRCLIAPPPQPPPTRGGGVLRSWFYENYSWDATLDAIENWFYCHPKRREGSQLTENIIFFASLRMTF